MMLQHSLDLPSTPCRCCLDPMAPPSSAVCTTIEAKRPAGCNAQVCAGAAGSKSGVRRLRCWAACAAHQKQLPCGGAACMLQPWSPGKQHVLGCDHGVSLSLWPQPFHPSPAPTMHAEQQVLQSAVAVSAQGRPANRWVPSDRTGSSWGAACCAVSPAQLLCCASASQQPEPGSPEQRT